MSQEHEPRDQETVSVGGIEFAHRDIFQVVDEFYTLIQHDQVLKIPFSSVADWPEHIRRLTHFWWVRFGGKPYLFNQYDPVAKHFFAGFNAELLTRWLTLFHRTLDARLTIEQAHLWKLISERMGQGLSVKNDLFRSEYERTQAGRVGDAEKDPNSRTVR